MIFHNPIEIYSHVSKFRYNKLITKTDIFIFLFTHTVKRRFFDIALYFVLCLYVDNTCTEKFAKNICIALDISCFLLLFQKANILFLVLLLLLDIVIEISKWPFEIWNTVCDNISTLYCYKNISNKYINYGHFEMVLNIYFDWLFSKKEINY